jgi:hypothetical protein
MTALSAGLAPGTGDAASHSPRNAIDSKEYHHVGDLDRPPFHRRRLRPRRAGGEPSAPDVPCPSACRGGATGSGRAEGPATRAAGVAADPGRLHRALAGPAPPAHDARLVDAVNLVDRDDAPSGCIGVAAVRRRGCGPVRSRAGAERRTDRAPSRPPRRGRARGARSCVLQLSQELRHSARQRQLSPTAGMCSTWPGGWTTWPGPTPPSAAPAPGTPRSSSPTSWPPSDSTGHRAAHRCPRPV